jgi:hypothetical protein
VFPSRVFRLSGLYVRRDSGIRSLEQLRGKKVGAPEWAQTASVYTRGVLTDDVGVKLWEIDWHQARPAIAPLTHPPLHAFISALVRPAWDWPR